MAEGAGAGAQVLTRSYWGAVPHSFPASSDAAASSALGPEGHRCVPITATTWEATCKAPKFETASEAFDGVSETRAQEFTGALVPKLPSGWPLEPPKLTVHKDTVCAASDSQQLRDRGPHPHVERTFTFPGAVRTIGVTRTWEATVVLMGQNVATAITGDRSHWQ